MWERGRSFLGQQAFKLVCVLSPETLPEAMVCSNSRGAILQHIKWNFNSFEMLLNAFAVSIYTAGQLKQAGEAVCGAINDRCQTNIAADSVAWCSSN